MAAKKMNIDLVEEMVTNYKTKQYLSILTNKINPMTFDAQSVWFKLDTLKEFIITIEEEAAKHPEHNLKNFGARFYYTAYPKNVVWDELGYEDIAAVDEKYEKLHTLIVIPTAEMDGVNCDFDPFDEKTYTGVRPAGAATAIMAENHGSLTPPESRSGLWF